MRPLPNLAVVVGFSVKCDSRLKNKCEAAGIKLLLEPVIYRLVEEITDVCTDQLPKIRETRVLGEAIVQEIFEISNKGKAKTVVAGCRVQNGAINRIERGRVMRNGQEVHEGSSLIFLQLVSACFFFSSVNDLMRPFYGAIGEEILAG